MAGHESQVAWAVNRPVEAHRLNEEARDLLGSSLVLSWFTVRMFDLRTSAFNESNVLAILHDMDQQPGRLSDRSLAAALHIAAIEAICIPGQEKLVLERLKALSALYRLI